MSRIKREKLFGRAINDWVLDLTMEDDAALVEYMLSYLDRLNIEYRIEKHVSNDNWIYIRVDCDDEMMSILRGLMADFEYDWDEEETALA